MVGTAFSRVIEQLLTKGVFVISHSGSYPYPTGLPGTEKGLHLTLTLQSSTPKPAKLLCLSKGQSEKRAELDITVLW